MKTEKSAFILKETDRKILALCAEGKTAKTIGEMLSKSPRTIESRLDRLKQRWCVSKTTELIAFAIKQNLL